MAYGVLVEEQKERDHKEDINIHERLLLKWILEK
jgi:hypothetical protein